MLILVIRESSTISSSCVLLKHNAHVVNGPFLYVGLCGCCRTRAGYSRADQFYASYPAGTELLTDTAKVCENNVISDLYFVLFGCELWFFFFGIEITLFFDMIWLFCYLLVVIFEFVICW